MLFNYEVMSVTINIRARCLVTGCQSKKLRAIRLAGLIIAFHCDSYSSKEETTGLEDGVDQRELHDGTGRQIGRSLVADAGWTQLGSRHRHRRLGRSP